MKLHLNCYITTNEYRFEKKYFIKCITFVNKAGGVLTLITWILMNKPITPSGTFSHQQ